MSKSNFYVFMGGLLAATATFMLGDSESASPLLARKAGGAPQHLLEKQQHRKADVPQKPDARLARKVGGEKTRLLYQQRQRYRRAQV